MEIDWRKVDFHPAENHIIDFDSTKRMVSMGAFQNCIQYHYLAQMILKNLRFGAT